MKVWKIVVGVAGGVLLAILLLQVPAILVYFSDKPKVERVATPGSPISTPAQEAQVEREAKEAFGDSAIVFKSN